MLYYVTVKSCEKYVFLFSLQTPRSRKIECATPNIPSRTKLCATPSSVLEQARSRSGVFTIHSVLIYLFNQSL